MIKYKTAPQILEHYLQRAGILDCIPDFEIEAILKAMRHYARVKSDKVIEKEREKIKDEMYEEARRNLLQQYNLN